MAFQPSDLIQHYARMSPEEFSAIKREDLREKAREIYDQELSRRGGPEGLRQDELPPAEPKRGRPPKGVGMATVALSGANGSDQAHHPRWYGFPLSRRRGGYRASGFVALGLPGIHRHFLVV